MDACSALSSPSSSSQFTPTITFSTSQLKPNPSLCFIFSNNSTSLLKHPLLLSSLRPPTRTSSLLRPCALVHVCLEPGFEFDKAYLNEEADGLGEQDDKESVIGKISNKATTNHKNKDKVYIATTPLRAPEGPAQLLMSTAYSLNLWNLHHYMVIIKLSTPQYTIFGKQVPGVVLERKLRKIPRKNCWFVGCSNTDKNGVRRFNESWDKNLKINHNDCSDYTKGLVEYMTGEKVNLELLIGRD